MQKWEYLAINLLYRDDSKSLIDSVAFNNRHAFSNMTKDEWYAYLKKLGSEGWELVNVHHAHDGRNETYYFKRPIE
jgi:hypothetical protein